MMVCVFLAIGGLTCVILANCVLAAALHVTSMQRESSRFVAVSRSRLRNVFENGSRAGTPEEERISRAHSNQEDLLIAVVILGIIVLALILIIIYGYCKYTRGRMEEKRSVARECTRDAAEQLEPVSEALEIPQEPIKTRKRSMTFTQNDEECRKYREDLADAYDNDRSRKKSTVTFVGVE